MKDYQPINCDTHDEIELACLRGVHLCIRTTDGEELLGKPVTTETDSSKQEWLLLKDGDRDLRIRLDRIRHFSPLTPGSRP